MVLYLSPDPHAARYDADLATELRSQYPDCRITTLGPGGDIDLPLSPGAWGAALLVPYAQVLAAALSDRLGFKVDNPFEGQTTLSRVVRGVTLHPVTP